MLSNAALMWLPLTVAAALCAALFMDNLATARASFRELLEPVRSQHTWVMCLLYIGTFGSFIGYSAAFGLLIKTQFTGVVVAHYAFIGPLVGSLVRPLPGHHVVVLPAPPHTRPRRSQPGYGHRLTRSRG
jgi:MFS transporter, NNP family, nitrate/nitrite transporter